MAALPKFWPSYVLWWWRNTATGESLLCVRVCLLRACVSVASTAAVQVVIVDPVHLVQPVEPVAVVEPAQSNIIYSDTPKSDSAPPPPPPPQGGVPMEAAPVAIIQPPIQPTMVQPNQPPPYQPPPAQIAAKFCAGCGTPLDASAQFCAGCGTPVN